MKIDENGNAVEDEKIEVETEAVEDEKRNSKANERIRGLVKTNKILSDEKTALALKTICSLYVIIAS